MVVEINAKPETRAQPETREVYCTVDWCPAPALTHSFMSTLQAMVYCILENDTVKPRYGWILPAIILGCATWDTGKHPASTSHLP